MGSILNKHKKELVQIIVSFIIFIFGILLPVSDYLKLAIFLAAYLIVGGEIVLRAVKNVIRGQIFDENFLMSIATIGAFLIGEYPEGVAVMLFYQVGELFQSYAVNQSRKSIAALMEIRPDYANVLRDGLLIPADPEEVLLGETIIIKPGEKIPLDGVVIKGEGSVDTKALTGESLPKDVCEGMKVISGCINLNGTLTVTVEKEYEDSTVAKILELVENAAGRKAETENFITKFARYYTPAVVIMAFLLAVIPPIFISGEIFSDWIYRALIFLVVSCPCALVISIPLGFFGGIGGASKKGILVKGGNYLELLSKAEIIVFDKTGTLTKGNFNVTKISPVNISNEELLEITAKAEYYSNHPISQSIKNAYNKRLSDDCVNEDKVVPKEIAGQGICALVDQKLVYVGNKKLMNSMNISFTESSEAGTVIYVAIDNIFAGSILIEDEVKTDAHMAVAELKKAGIRKTVMLTGDSKEIGEKIAKELELDEVYTELLPADKVKYLEKIYAAKSEKGKLIFVGDGINDAPVLARADIGIAMGGLGQDAAIEAADIVIMTDEPSKIVTAIEISKKTLRIVMQNIVFALGVKGIVLILSAFGMSTMWEAVFADVGVSVIAILNSMRLLYKAND